MGSTPQYWRLVRLDGTGRRRVEELALAKQFWQSLFPPPPDSTLRDSSNDLDPAAQIASTPPHAVAQRSLLQISQDSQAPTQAREAAELCLRCFISHQIEQTCIQLEEKFGQSGSFSRRDLLPLVLDDDGQLDSQRTTARTAVPQAAARTTAAQTAARTAVPQGASLTPTAVPAHPPQQRYQSLARQGRRRCPPSEPKPISSRPWGWPRRSKPRKSPTSGTGSSDS